MHWGRRVPPAKKGYLVLAAWLLLACAPCSSHNPAIGTSLRYLKNSEERHAVTRSFQGQSLHSHRGKGLRGGGEEATSICQFQVTASLHRSPLWPNSNHVFISFSSPQTIMMVFVLFRWRMLNEWPCRSCGLARLLRGSACTS
jgi:hypothetical protein